MAKNIRTSFFVLLLSCCAGCALQSPRVNGERNATGLDSQAVNTSQQRSIERVDRAVDDYASVQNVGEVQDNQPRSLESIFLAEVGVREATNNNDGERVEEYLAAVGKGKGNAWCAAFVRWCFDQAGIRTTITAWSPSAENRKNKVWYERKLLKEPISGDVFCIRYAKKQRIGHTGFYYRRLNERIFETVEGNTDPSGGSEGDGVYQRKRTFNQTHSITRWIGD